jgi:membrane protein
VRKSSAVIGALITALVFEAAKRVFAGYISSGASYQEIYGALAIVPIFIFWIYLSWILVLLGASLTASIAAFDYRLHLPEIILPTPRSDGDQATLTAKPIPEEKP